MITVLSDEKLITICKESKVAFWGAGYIAAKTFERCQLSPSIIFDNNPDIEGDKQLGTLVKKPSNDLINKIDYIVITSSSILEIKNQILTKGFLEENIFVAPVLKDVFAINIFESQEFDFTFSSGLQNDFGENKIGGGGLYRLKGLFDDFELTKILNGSTHGIFKKDEKYICINEKLGICELDSNLNLIKNHPIQKGYRPHGIDYCKKNNKWVLACAHYDGILVLDSNFNHVDELLFSTQKYSFNNAAQHHCNDICVVEGKAYVSMFSLKGNWKRGIYDGGVLIIDLKTMKVESSLYDDLLMPHNIVYKNKMFWVLDSLRGYVIKGSEDKITKLPSFTRGFDILKNGNLLIGQSKNRNFSLLKSKSNHISLDTSIIIHNEELSISKSLHLPSSVSEIHSICNLEK